MPAAAPSSLTDPTSPPGGAWLSGRAAFETVLGSHLVQEAGRSAVFVLELTDLADIAGTYGGSMAAAIVAEAGHRFLDIARPGPGGTLAQLGEARFITFAAGLANRDQAFRMARRLCRDMARPLTIQGLRLALTFCVGVSFSEDHHEAAAELIDQSETALNEARRHGAGAFCLFSPDMEERMRRRMLLRESLQQAIDTHQLQLHYQPIVDLATGRVRAAEALSRWHHPELGVQSPADFIPAAEASGLIVPLGKQMLLRALQDRQEWRKLALSPPPVAVNVSAVQLQRPGFVEMVTRALAQAEAVPEDLELELTEGTLIETTGNMLEQLGLLSRMGITLTVDDFGTGFSSLRYLRDMPVRKLKIDQYFIRDIADDSRDLSITRAIVAMATALELEVVAEGIETEAQRVKLLEVGCRVGQGYLFAPPMSADEFGRLLKRELTVPVAAPPPGIHGSLRRGSA